MLNERLRSDAKPFFFYSICKEAASVKCMDWKLCQSLRIGVVWICSNEMVLQMEKLQDNMQFDIIAIRNLQISYSHFIATCKLFSCESKPIHAFLAS